MHARQRSAVQTTEVPQCEKCGLSSQPPEHKSIVAAPHEGYSPNDRGGSLQSRSAEWGQVVSTGIVNARSEKPSGKLV